MATIVTRAGKGSFLTHNEVDANFTNLNTDKLELSDLTNEAAVKALNQGVATTDSPTFAALDVNGTVTADGLETIGATVNTSPLRLQSLDTSVNLGESIGDIEFYSNDSSGGGTGVQAKISAIADNSFGTSYALNFLTGANASPLQRLNIAYNGDISFYEDTGTTPKFFWDASAEALGIGTSSPESVLHIASETNGTNTFTMESLDAFLSSNQEANAIEFQTNDGSATGVTGKIAHISENGNEDLALSFSTFNGTLNEAMRIDSSGNVGIGTSSPDGDLHVYDADGDCNLILETGTNNSQVGFADSASNFVGKIQYNHPSNYMGFTVNASERMRIDSSGNVGIGKVPAYKFEVSDGTRDAIINPNAVIDGIFVGVRQAKPLVFGTSDTERMRIDSSGNVLVGKTSQTGTGVGIELEADGTFYVGKTGDVATFNRTTSVDGTLIQFQKQGITVGSIGSYFGDLYISSPSSTDAGIGIGASTVRPVTTTGAERDAAVDLGRTTARWKDLYLSNNIIIDDGAGRLTLDAASGINYLYSTTTGFAAYEDLAIVGDNLIFRNGASERLRITSSGDVLLGTTTRAGHLTLDRAYGGGTAVSLNTTNTGTAYTGMAFRQGGTLVGFISVGASSTVYATSSDYRLKENVTTLDGAAYRLEQIPVHRFNFIADPDTTVDGFLAHEVQEIVPEAVTGEKDAVDADGNPVYQGIDQSKLVPLLTAALQEALQKIDALEARVATLEAN